HRALTHSPGRGDGGDRLTVVEHPEHLPLATRQSCDPLHQLTSGRPDLVPRPQCLLTVLRTHAGLPGGDGAYDLVKTSDAGGHGDDAVATGSQQSTPPGDVGRTRHDDPSRRDRLDDPHHATPLVDVVDLGDHAPDLGTPFGDLAPGLEQFAARPWVVKTLSLELRG